jgi:hypothetical protein
MSSAAFSARIFAVYVFIVGAVLAIAPNFLLALFRLPLTSEVWIRLLGVIAFNVGVFAWVAAKHEDKHFFEASVITRCGAFAAIVAMVVLGLASPVILLFGVAELAGAIWTWLALRADAVAVATRHGCVGNA